MAAELPRRLVHASGAALPGAYLLDVLTWGQVRLLFAAGLVVAVGLELVRLVVGLDWAIYEKLTREYEQDNPAGYALYMFSGSLTGLAFEPRIAVPAILMLTLADPISGLLSTGELRPIKRLRVLATMFGLCTAIAAAFVPLPAAVLGGFGAMLADGVKPVMAGYVVDDNLTIPLVAAGAMTVGLAAPPLF